MNGRSNASLLATLALLSVAFAGCLEAPSFLTDSDAEATAQENKDLADNAAAAWNPEAVLVGVAAFEASPDHAAQSHGYVPADPTVGNGRALLWLYAYQTPEGNESRLFRVDADGRIQVENTSMVPTQDIGQVDPVGAWALDSDAAMVAAQGDALFREAATATNASVLSSVGSHEGLTKWALVAISEEKVVVAVVDATTGELLLVEPVDMGSFEMPAMPDFPGFEMGPVVHLEGSGDLDGSERTAEHPFTYAGMGDEGMLVLDSLDFEAPFPTERLAWKIVDEEGEAVASGRSGQLPSDRQTTFHFELEEPGEYVLVFTYAPVAMLALGGVSYEFTLDVGGFEEIDVEGRV